MVTIVLAVLVIALVVHTARSAVEPARMATRLFWLSFRQILFVIGTLVVLTLLIASRCSFPRG